MTPPGGCGSRVGLFLVPEVGLWHHFHVTVAKVDVLKWNGRTSMINFMVVW